MRNSVVPATASGLPTSILLDFGSHSLVGVAFVLAEEAHEAHEMTQRIGDIIARLTGIGDTRSAVRA